MLLAKLSDSLRRLPQLLALLVLTRSLDRPPGSLEFLTSTKSSRKGTSHPPESLGSSSTNRSISSRLTQSAETCGQPLEVVTVEEPPVGPDFGHAMNELTDSDPDTQKWPLE